MDKNRIKYYQDIISKMKPYLTVKGIKAVLKHLFCLNDEDISLLYPY